MNNSTNQNELNGIDKLALLSNILQIVNTYLNVKQSSNDEIMGELDKQNNVFFKIIINKLEKIENKLNEIENNRWYLYLYSI